MPWLFFRFGRTLVIFGTGISISFGDSVGAPKLFGKEIVPSTEEVGSGTSSATCGGIEDSMISSLGTKETLFLRKFFLGGVN